MRTEKTTEENISEKGKGKRRRKSFIYIKKEKIQKEGRANEDCLPHCVDDSIKTVSGVAIRGLKTVRFQMLARGGNLC